MCDFLLARHSKFILTNGYPKSNVCLKKKMNSRVGHSARVENNVLLAGCF